MTRDDYGARIERGKIIAAEGTEYKVQSYTRDGIITPKIPAIRVVSDKYPNEIVQKYEVGDKVYFFLFDDGHGAIIAKF